MLKVVAWIVPMSQKTRGKMLFCAGAVNKFVGSTQFHIGKVQISARARPAKLP